MRWDAATAIQALALALSLATAAITLHIRNEIAETKLAIIERLTSQSDMDRARYPSRNEFDQLSGRVSSLEIKIR